jgi:hypothetical protein
MGFKVRFNFNGHKCQNNQSVDSGFVVSDWGATHDSAADNANAGLDMEQPGDFILIGASIFGSG